MIINMTESEYIKSKYNSSTTRASNEGVVLFFSADWCEPCHRLHDLMEKVIGDYPSVTVINIDTDAADNLLEIYEVKNNPTLKFIKGNEIIDSTNRTLNESDLRSKLASLS